MRDKAHANTEFGAKTHVSVEDGFAHVEYLGFDAYNEATGFKAAVEAYRAQTELWPGRVLADKIYRTRENLAWCKERGIEMSGPRLGRPPKDKRLSRERRNVGMRSLARGMAVEGVFGTAKTTYGLDPVAVRLEDTAKTVICMAILVFNLKKKISLSLFSNWFIGLFYSWIPGNSLCAL